MCWMAQISVEHNWDPPSIENWPTSTLWSYLFICHLLVQRPSLLHYSSLVSLKSIFDKVHFDFWTKTFLILADASKELQLPKTGLCYKCCFDSSQIIIPTQVATNSVLYYTVYQNCLVLISDLPGAGLPGPDHPWIHDFTYLHFRRFF